MRIKPDVPALALINVEVQVELRCMSTVKRIKRMTPVRESLNLFCYMFTIRRHSQEDVDDFGVEVVP